jgi:hypothetical protein
MIEAEYFKKRLIKAFQETRKHVYRMLDGLT